MPEELAMPPSTGSDSLEATIAADLAPTVAVAPEAPTAPEVPVIPSVAPEAPPSDAASEDPFAEESDEDLEPKPGQQQPNVLDLASSRGKRIYQSYKAFKGMVENLGFEPSIDDIKGHYQRSNDMSAMESDWTSGNPADVANFLDQWGQYNADGMAAMVRIMPDYVARMASATQQPQLYAEFATPVISRYEKMLFQRAEQTADPALKESLLHAARVLQWDRTGEFDQGQPAVAAPKGDPLARERQALQAEYSRLNQARQEQTQTQQRAWADTTNNEIRQALTAQVDQALTLIKDRYKDDQFAYDSLKDRFTKLVHEHVAKNADGMRQFNLRYGSAVRTQSDQDRADLSRLYLAMARTAIQATRGQVLGSASRNLKQQSDQVHAQLAQTAGKVAPNTAGAPRSHNAAAPPAGATATERLEWQINKDLGL